MKQIHITRTGNTVQFETVSIDPTQNVFFTNLDPQQPHWPDIAANQIGPFPSPNSSQCPLPPNTPTGPFQYKCKIHGEVGTINVFAALAAGTTALPQATKGQPIAAQQVVKGGLSPYAISAQVFQIKDQNNNVIQQGSGIGPGLQLNPSNNNNGISVSGSPTVSGTYNFTFTVNDGTGRNLQQVQYTMKVV